MNTTLNVRIETATKKKASKTLACLGLDMSTAVKMFLQQVIIEDGLPFTPTKNEKQIRAKWDAAVADAKKHGKSFTTAEEMLADL